MTDLHTFDVLRDRLNENARRHFKRTHGEDKRADECRLPWSSIRKCAERLGIDTHLAVPGTQWDDRGGGYWRVVHLSTTCAQNSVEAILVEDSDSPWMWDNFELYWRSERPHAGNLINLGEVA